MSKKWLGMIAAGLAVAAVVLGVMRPESAEKVQEKIVRQIQLKGQEESRLISYSLENISHKRLERNKQSATGLWEGLMAEGMNALFAQEAESQLVTKVQLGINLYQVAF